MNVLGKDMPRWGEGRARPMGGVEGVASLFPRGGGASPSRPTGGVEGEALRKKT